MYKYLFGNTSLLPLYDMLGILGYLVIIGLTLYRANITRKHNSLRALALHWKNHRVSPKRTCKKAEQCHDSSFRELSILLFAHIITYTFGGEFFGPLLGRRTDYYGYVFITNLIICIVCYILHLNVLQELDSLVPIYLAIASLLKIGCLCSGCCNGFEWESGLFNYRTQRNEFPIQLVESFLYFTLLIFFVKFKSRFAVGTISPFFIIIYASLRFVIQFFREDSPPFSFFHFFSLIAVIVGMIHLFIVQNFRQQIIDIFCRQ